MTFRNDIVSGPGGRQILLEDPAGNPIELFQPAGGIGGPCRSLTALLPRLAAALTAGAAQATRPPDGAGVGRSFADGWLRIDLRLLADPLPRVRLQLDPPADARALCAAWAIARPVAVSPDVHQHTWQILVAGEELADPYARRIAAEPIRAGRWDVMPYLAAGPGGELPASSAARRRRTTSANAAGRWARSRSRPPRA